LWNLAGFEDRAYDSDHWLWRREFKECGKYFLAKYIECNTSYNRSENKKIERLQGYYELLNKWVAVKNRRGTIDEFLISHCWKKVSIYGYGEIGKRLYEELNQSKSIRIVSIIDNSLKKSNLLLDIDIYSLSDKLPEADITIITPVFAFESIKNDLKKKGVICCISIEEILNKQAGAWGVSGVSSDYKDIEDGYNMGDQRSILTLDSQAYKIAQYIGQYVISLGGLDVLTFAGGVGENGVETRERICKYLEPFGIKLDIQANKVRGKEQCVSTDDSKAKIFVIPTNEELMIAKETYELIK